MKRAMISMLILAVLSLWTPIANAENTQDLDPMVSPEAQTTMTSESATTTLGNGQVSEGVTVAPTTAMAPAVEKKTEETKKGKSKKSDKKKSSEKKSEKKAEKKAKKTSSKGSKKHKKSSSAQ